jgi:hypothetical protein
VILSNPQYAFSVLEDYEEGRPVPAARESAVYFGRKVRGEGREWRTGGAHLSRERFAKGSDICYLSTA